MLANLQKLITLSLAAAALCWFFHYYNSAPWLALGGFLLVILGYSSILALEFIFLYFVNKSDPAPQASPVMLVKAWLGETLTAPRVFFWRQPFRSRAVADQLSPPSQLHGHRGVVFVHGFFCNRGLWTPWLQRLQGSPHAFTAISMEPVLGSIDDYSDQIDAAVDQITRVTGQPPLLVCHSMGGLAARAWLKSRQAEARIHRVVTIATPHGGTWLARFGIGDNTGQMRLASEWLGLLDYNMPVHRPSLFTCWYSNCDNIAFPTSTAALPGADNRLVQGVAHVQLAFWPEVMDATLAMLDDPQI
ncbi:MAG: alpha/beta fold hydrolase [Pseudomonadota bacterium]